MKHLSLLTTLLLTSSMVYAGDWTYHNFNPDTKMYNPVPKYSCLEMICKYGCVEDKQGNGECCPAPVEGTNCASDTRNEKGCILSLKKTCPSNQYCNISTQTCQLIPSCNPCQKFDSDKGQCVADTSKNNQQVQDACHICKDGNVVLKDQAKQFISNNTCVECLADYGTGESGACTTEAKPLCQNNVCQACPAEKPYWKNGTCQSTAYEKKLPKSVSFSIHNGGDKHTSCKSKHKVYVYVEALSTNKGTFTGTLSLKETDSDNHRKYLRLNGQKFSKDTQYNYSVSLEPGDKKLVATYSDKDNFAKSSSRGKITITKANLSGKFSGGTGEVKVQIKHSPSCSLSWVSDNENGFGPNGGTYSY